jgi:hypothetical protein
MHQKQPPAKVAVLYRVEATPLDENSNRQENRKNIIVVVMVSPFHHIIELLFYTL